MATSIEQAVNWRNVTNKPDYQVAARQVDTYVQPQRNIRGEQIAKALGKVSGNFATVATRKEAEQRAFAANQKAAEAQAAEEVSDSERMRASNLGSFWTPKIKAFVEKQNYSKVDGVRPTQEQVYALFHEAHPEYQESFKNLETHKGRTALGDVTGDMFYGTYSESLVAQEASEDAQELNTLITNRIASIPPPSDGSITSDFRTLINDIDVDVTAMKGGAKESYKVLGEAASITANKNGDFRTYDWLISKNIGGTEQQKNWIKERAAIKSKRAQQRNQRNTEVADKLKADKVLLAQEGAKLFNTDAPVTSEQEIALIQKYIEQGVPNADSLVKTMASNYRTIQKVVMTPEQESNIWQGFIAAGSPDNQRNFIQAQVNKKAISQGLATQLYSRLGNSNDKFLLQDVVYQQYFKGVETLSKKSTGFMGALENSIDYAYIRPLFQKKYLEMATAPDWKDKDPDVELANLFNAMRQLREINQSDFLSDGKTVNNQNDAQQLSELMNPETPEDVAERAARTAELQARIEARRKEAQATQ